MGMSGDFADRDRRRRDADSRGNGAVRETSAVDWPRGMKSGMIRAVEGGVSLAVRAQPGAKKTAIVGVYGEGGVGTVEDCGAGAAD